MRRFPPVPRRTSVVRLFSGIVIAVGLALTTISAQIPGRNINMVAGNQWPDGDPYLQRQNEPSIGASTRNPLHLIAGANDYRTVDLPGLAEDETGDAWLGLFKSYDGGQRWISTLIPGYPQDHSAAGLSSPIHGYGAAADSVVRAGTNGLMYYAGLTFDRANPATPDVPGKSAIFVARFIDNNNKEAGDPFEYLGTRALQTDPGGVTGNFLDKPWMVVDIPRDNSRCTIVTPGEKGPITQSLPAGPVYVAYTLRSTDNKGARYDVMFTRSADCGNTWTAPIKLNNNSERANQGASLAVDPRNGNVYIAWRQFDVSTNATGTDALMAVKFTLANKKLEVPGFARKFAKPKNGKGKGLDLTHFYKKGGVNKALEAAELSPLDQSTSAAQIRFRTNAYPTMVVDETGRVYLAFAERGYDPLNTDPVLGSARVLMTTSMDGQTWTAARAVSSGEPNQHGHQLMPSLTYAGGKLMLIYYDVRQTRAQAFTRYIDDRTAFQPGVGTGLRHTIDLRASMASPGAVPSFAPSVPVSEYIEGPRVPGGPSTPWQVNPPNLPMFQKGTAPFIGDYVDIAAAPNFIINAAAKWTYNNVAGSTPPIFHAAWTDNRDVRVPLHDLNGDGNPWNDYTPPTGPGGAPSIFDPTKTVPMCIPGNAGSRNQNIYTARITGGLLAGSPGNSKRLGYRLDANGNPETALMQRSFVVFAQNTSDSLKRFRFSITNQPVGGRASFEQFSSLPLTVIEADIPYRSTVSRTVYATSTDPHAVINVSVAELVFANGQWVVKSGGLGSVIVLNPDIDNPDIDNPDIDNPDIDNPDIDNAEVYNPDIDNPDIDNPDIDNPDIDNPDIDNPDIDNVNVANPDIDNPDIDNPDIDNPDIDNPDIDNPDIDNPDIDNASLMTDVSWSITNTGNTTASYNVNLFFAQQSYDPTIKTQLILYRTYKTPVVVNCDLKTQTRNVLVANVPNPHLVKGSTGQVSNPNDSAATNATIYLAPGESAKITLRVFDPSPDPGSVVTVTNRDGSTALISSQFVPNEDVTPVVQQQSVNTEDVDEGVTEPPVVVQFPAPQTVPDSASTSENTPVTFNPLANDSSAFGSTKILSFHPAGMAAHSGSGAGDVVYQPSTGFLYTLRGAVDPATSALVGRFPVPPGGFGITHQQANPRTGINYGRTSAPLAALSALDARPDSPTFHQYLPIPNGPALSDSVISFTMDTSRNRMYVLHGPQTAGPSSPTTVSVIDINPGSETFHQVVRSISLPVGVRSQTAAVNPRTNKLYVGVGGVQGGSQPGGVFVIDLNAAVPSALRIPNTNSGGFSLIVNEAANLVFASTPLNGGAQAGIFAIDGGSNAAVLIPLPGAFRFSSHDERFALHEASGKVFYRLEAQVAVIDGQRGSPTRNTVLAMVNVGRENGNVDIAIDQELGLAITVGSFDFQADIISVAGNALATSIPLSTFAQDVAIDPIHHRAFVGVFTYVQEIELAPISLGAAIPVFIESGSILLNPVRNRGYAGLFNTQAKVEVISGAGLAGDLTGALTQGRYLYSEWHANTNRGFIINQGNSGGTGSNPGTVLVVDGASEGVLGYADVLPQPFGIGIDQVANKVYVASLSSPFGHGGVTVVDPTSGDTAQVTFTAAFPGAYPNFPLNNTGALLSFGRQVVANPVTHKVYVTAIGGTASSIGVIDPAGAMKPLDGIAGSPLFTAANPAACGGAPPQPACASWGRVSVIRVLPALNRVYLGLLDDNNIGRIVALDATTDAVVGSWVGGSHSNRHTASFLAVNETLQRLYVTDYTHNVVTMLNPSTLQPIVTTTLAGGPSATAINQESNRLYVSSVDSKTIYAIDGTTLQIVSSVRLPLTAYFMWVDSVESRIYTSGGDSADESGAMVITDVLGQLGTNVSITSVGSALHGTAVLNPLDYSVKYTPNPGYSGPDSFTYSIAAPTGTAIGTVSVNVVPSIPAAAAFGDSYNAVVNQLLTVPAPGPLGNDATGGSFTTMVVDNTAAHGTLTPTANGAFTYQPNEGFTGVDSFQYHAVTDSLGATNPVTVTITVTSPTSLLVTNTNDSGAGSLRNAISIANVEPNSVIRFNISGNPSQNGAYVIAPQSPLPSLAAPVTIDGYTQPGASPNTSAVGTNAVIKIELRGTSIPGGGGDGLQINGGGSTIRGLAIGGFRSAGIFLGGAAGSNVVEGNFLGTDASGLVAVPNGAFVQTIANGAGITSRSPNNVIGGPIPAARNLISGNLAQGVRVDSQNGAAGNGAGTWIANNLIGTNATGLVALANGVAALNNGNGIAVTVPNVIIGGPPGSRNVISGNNGVGISAGLTVASANPQVVLTRSSDLVVQGNWIGVKADGSAALPNTGLGMFLSGERSQVGGTTGPGVCSDACNVIAGNGGAGVNLGNSIDNFARVVTSSAAGSIVEGNYIGVGPSGTAVPNGGVALSITAPNVRVGGSTASQRNVISGNGGSGIVLGAQNFADNTPAVSSAGGVVTGNYIGVGADGVTQRPNGGNGVWINNASDITIGGANAADGNLIAGNAASGVLIQAGGVRNRILSNLIHSNGGLEIDLNGGGITPNDNGDADSGANNLQNFPVLSRVDNSGPTTTVDVDMSTFVPGPGYTVQFFANAVCEPGGNGGGQRLVGTTQLFQPGNGNVALTELVPNNQFITATATDSNGNTSEFSRCATTVPAPVITSVTPSNFGPGQMVTIDGSNFAPLSPNDITFVQAAASINATYLWTVSPTRIVARTSGSLIPGAVQVVINASGGAPASAPFNAVVGSGPAAPVLRNLFAGSCNGGYTPSDISSAAAGSNITAIADGIDTSGASFLFTNPAGGSVTVVATVACAGPAGRVAVSATVPSGMTPGSYSVRLRQLIVESTSPASNAIGLNVTPVPVSVNGFARYSSTPLPNVVLKLTQGGPTTPPVATVVSAADGSFHFADVAPGNYDLRIDGPDSSYLTWVANGITVGSANVTQDMYIPRRITLSSPPNGSTGVTATPNLTWSANPEAHHYQVQINRTSDFLLIENTTVGTNAYTVTTTLTGSTNYTWQVGAYDANGHYVGATEQSFTFTVAPGTAFAAAGSGSTSVTDDGSTSFTPKMSYSNNGLGQFNGSWTFSTVATKAATMPIDFDWTGFHSFYQATASMTVFVNRGGNDIFTATLVNAGPQDCPPCTPPSSGFTYTGSTAVTVQPGDTYGFRLNGSHYDGTYVLQGNLNLTLHP